jgi:DNA-binding MarR family transcriptional regulator
VAAHRLVARKPDPADRRAVNVRLTGAGREAINSALQRFLQTAGRVARLVTGREQTVASVLCGRLRIGAGGTS